MSSFELFQGLLTCAFNQECPLYHYDPLSIRGESLRKLSEDQETFKMKARKQNGNGRFDCDIPSSR